MEAFAPLGSLINNLFDLNLGIDEKILRSLLVFLFLVVALRLAGKRELAQLNVLDFAVLLLVSNVLQNAMIGDDNTVTGGIVGATTLFAANYLFVRLTFRSKTARRVLEGRPVILLEDGKIDREEMKKQVFPESDLLGVILERGFTSIDEVGLVVLQTNGHLAVLGPKAAEQWKRGQMLGVGPDPMPAET